MLKQMLLAAAVAITALGAPLTLAAQDSDAPVAPGPGRPVRPPVSSYAKPTAWPKEDRSAVIETLSRARKIAGPEMFGDFAHRCIFSPGYRTRVSGIQYNGLLEPTKIFDNLYSVGQVAVSSHALVTTDGIVIFDTLNNEAEAKEIIVPNLVKLGLDPRAIKYVVITHAHGDHYGGARYLQKTYGAKVIASKIDWDAMDRSRGAATGPFAGLEPPVREIEVADGQHFKVGDTDLQFFVTPGHTMGVLSTIFKVSWKGRQHTVGYFGGTGGGGQPENLRAQIVSLARWEKITKAAGADVLIANHPLHDRGMENNELLHYLKPGDPNPYIIGVADYQKYMQLQSACASVYLARYGFSE